MTISSLRAIQTRVAGAVSTYLKKNSRQRPTTPLGRIRRRLLLGVRRAVYLARNRAPGRAEIWRGEDAAGRPFTVGFVCDAAALKTHSPPYLRHILFAADTVKITPCGSVTPNGMQPAARRLAREVDLVIVERADLLDWQPEGGTLCVLPLHIHMVLDLSPQRPWQEIEKSMHHHTSNIKKAHRNGYTYRFSRDPADFDLFYERMWKPTVKTRFDEYAAVKPRAEMEAFFNGGGLSIVEDPAGQVVAAELDMINGAKGFSIANGILDGDEAYYASGAMSAVYYFRTRWCYDNGITTFDSGGCRPFKSDGIYEYKRRWGFHPVADEWNSREWLFWAPNNAPVALDWLAQHPPIEVMDS